MTPFLLPDVQAVEDVVGPLHAGEMTITRTQARQLEHALGLEQGTLERENVISLIGDIPARAPAAPYQNIGNSNFLGGGKGLPGGGPEITIDGVSSLGVGYGGSAPVLQRILLKVVE